MAESRMRKPRSTMPTDEWVGSKIRMRRNTLGMTQMALAAAIGVTFQQVQKYEKGVNRVGAGRLQHIARVLGMPVSWFFEGAPKAPKSGAEPADKMSDFGTFMQSRYAPVIVSSFVHLPDTLQKSLTHLISQVAAEQP